jgi:hypothetical protein
MKAAAATSRAFPSHSSARPADTLWYWAVFSRTSGDFRVVYVWRALILLVGASEKGWRPMDLLPKSFWQPTIVDGVTVIMTVVEAWLFPALSTILASLAMSLLSISQPSSAIAVLVMLSDVVGTFLIGPFVYSFVWENVRRVHVCALGSGLLLIVLNVCQAYILLTVEEPLHLAMKLEFLTMVASLAHIYVVYAYYQPRDNDAANWGLLSIFLTIFLLEFLMMCIQGYDKANPSFLETFKERHGIL